MDTRIRRSGVDTLHLTRGRSKRRLIPTQRQIQLNRRIKRTLFNRSAGSGVYLEGNESAIAADIHDRNTSPIGDGFDPPLPSGLCGRRLHQAPAFLRSSGAKLRKPDQANFRKYRLFASVITKARSLLALLRRTLSQDISDARMERPARGGPGAALALISLIVIVAGVGAAIALTQIRSLRSEIAAIHRELAPLKERVAQLDQAEKARRQAEQQQDAKDKSAIERSNRIGETQAALNLSSEEIQLVKVYIRPAPSIGAPADAIKVGDIVDGATIPLPSPLTEKIPKLLGARFAIRNGAIIIVRKDSRQADAVLAPN